MTQHPGSALTSASERAAALAPVHRAARNRRLARTAAAGLISFGMVGVFALPAYASAPEAVGTPDGFVVNQRLSTPVVDAADAPGSIAPIEASTAELDAELIAAEQRRADQAAAEERRVAEAAAQARTAPAAAATATVAGDVPAGVGASGIASAALSQLGQIQDCTALVERALRAVGIPAGDLGTQIGEYTALGGVLVTSGSYAPGDVLIWSGRHVAVYIGNGQAVHGGYGGNQTVVAGAFIDGAPNGVVRFG